MSIIKNQKKQSFKIKVAISSKENKKFLIFLDVFLKKSTNIKKYPISTRGYMSFCVLTSYTPVLI
jgi:hypothetical protein